MQDIQFRKTTKWFFVVFFTLLLLSVAALYYRHMVLEDYRVFIEFDEEGTPINIEE